MTSLILHHYPMSPFSQKIRTMLGYANVQWLSVITREMPPRPLLERLTGGYRKIPVAQIGADIFCDTRTIAAEIARMAGRPGLALENCSADAQAYVKKVDLQVFFACLTVSGTGTLLRKVRQSMSWPDIARFAWDRINIGRKAAVRAVPPHKARAYVQAHLADAEQRLTQDFLFGAHPTHADFSTWHSLWFVRELAESPLVNPYPRTMAWMDRMKAFGEGHAQPLTAEQALEIARNATPRAIPPEFMTDPMVGKLVRIAPSDYGQVPAEGVLVGVTPSQWILAREEAGLGTLHVHFPRDGFLVTAC
ncbi:MAG TPA: glutathione S-transferase family protein [Moraxellaceae bacterium]|nr:glutathione S-transferase family protein [Moraxellaceae bacterium]